MNDQASNILAGEVTGEAPTTGRSTIAFEDAALVERTRKGDMRAFGLLVAKYQDRIFSMVLRMCSQRAIAEELTQEAFLKALQRLGQFRGQSKFYTWLFRIAANLAISHRRRAGRVRFQSLTGPEEFDGSQADRLTAGLAARRQVSPPAAAISAENQRRIAQALEELDEEFRLVVILRDIEEMDYAGIAEVTGLPVGTVKSRIHRGRCALKEKLRDLVDVKWLIERRYNMSCPLI